MADIFLDLDGTLTDPKEGITGSFIHALQQMGRDAPAPDDLEWIIGPPQADSFRAIGFEDKDIETAIAHYRARYDTWGKFACTVYDGVPLMLKMLRDGGHRLHLATSKPLHFARQITDHFDVTRHLNGIFGSELDGTRSDKSDLLAHALSATGADPAQSCMVGDRKYDAIGARANGVTPVGALWGYGGASELRSSGVDILAEHPAQIPELIPA